MELGMGFCVGLLAGLVIAMITAVVVAVSRKAVNKNKARRSQGLMDAGVNGGAASNSPGNPGNSASATAPGNDTISSPRSSGHTIIVGQVESQDGKFNQSVNEVRELLLQLAAVISSAESASGEACESFTTARSAIGKISAEQSPDLAEAQQVLLGEIDKVIRSNANLRSELDQANKGIEAQCQQIEDLRRQARIDALTKIPNRAAFDSRMEEYIGLLTRSKLCFCLLLMDIDFFKNVNDEYGHLNGDRILRGIASRIVSSIRTNDFAARYGGEEFAVILPATDMAEAIAVAERIRADIAKTNFRMDDVNIKITLSGGLTETRPGMDVEATISAADQALYQAKKLGRNRVVVNSFE